jgi:glycosyltransferase involved in cell wall biosynthesis
LTAKRAAGTTSSVPARHILIPIHDFSAGGTELIAFRLARHWLAAGRQVSILAGASDGPLRPRVPDGAQVHILSPERPRSATSRLFLGGRMAPVAQSLAPDAIFIPGNFHFMLGGALRRALPRAAIVAKASNPVWSADAAPAALARAIVARGTAGIDRIVAMSAALEPEVARYVGTGRTCVIDDPFLDDGAVIAARAGLPETPLKLLTVARLEPQKDPHLAIAIVAALHQRGHEAHLTILGGGPMQAALTADIQRRGLSGHIHLAGYVADPAPFYRGADLLLMTSRFEGVPAVIGEALTGGLPFVATDCSAWLARLATDHPALGSVVAAREPEALAAALLARSGMPYPSALQIEQGIGAHRSKQAAQAYLDLFNKLVPD